MILKTQKSQIFTMWQVFPDRITYACDMMWENPPHFAQGNFAEITELVLKFLHLLKTQNSKFPSRGFHRLHHLYIDISRGRILSKVARIHLDICKDLCKNLCILLYLIGVFTFSFVRNLRKFALGASTICLGALKICYSLTCNALVPF